MPVYASRALRGCTATRSTALSIPTLTPTAVTFTTETFDSDGFFTPTSGSFTVPAALDGKVFTVVCRFTLAGAVSWSTITKNGTDVGRVGHGNQSTVLCSFTGPLAAGDVMGCSMQHAVGSNQDLTPATFEIYVTAP